MLRRSLDLGEICAARGVARLDAGAWVLARPAFGLGAGKRHEAAVEARRGPRKARLRRALIPARMSAKRRLQLDQPHATAIIAVGIGTRDAGLEGPPLAWRHVIGDTFARKARAEVESGLAQIFIRRRQADTSWKCCAVSVHRYKSALVEAGVGACRPRRRRIGPTVERDQQGSHGKVMIGR